MTVRCLTCRNRMTPPHAWNGWDLWCAACHGAGRPHTGPAAGPGQRGVLAPVRTGWAPAAGRRQGETQTHDLS